MRTFPQLTFGEALKSTCKNYVNYSGRARRSEFCKSFFVLYYIFGGFMGGCFSIIFNEELENIRYILAPILGFLPFISLFIRRFHYIGKSGIYFFIVCVPGVGIFFLIYYLFLDSEDKSNEYGPSPKYIPVESFMNMK